MNMPIINVLKKDKTNPCKDRPQTKTIDIKIKPTDKSNKNNNKMFLEEISMITF